MPLVAVPNVSASEKRDVSTLAKVVERGARLLDVHHDSEHGRAVFTCTGAHDELPSAMSALAEGACRLLDLTTHRGLHPHVGTLDVCPFVPHEIDMAEAIAAARDTAQRVGEAGIPVYLYGEASPTGRTLPEIRSGGLRGVVDRLSAGIVPDEGPGRIDPKCGVVCVGARDVLIALNVWIDRDVGTAREIAREVRSELQAVRALGLGVSSHGSAQVSMNLLSPQDCGIDLAFAAVERIAAAYDATPVATEIVGLVPDRYLPDPDATTARLLIEPGRSLEQALQV